MNKVFKCALIKEQVEGALRLANDYNNLIEIQLLSVKDDLSLLANFNDKISSIHLPIKDNLCDLTVVMSSCATKDNYFNFLNEIIKKCPDTGLVIHADDYAEHLYNLKSSNPFLKWVSENNVKVFLENTGITPDLKKGILAPKYISVRFNEIIKKDLFHPLLDICHFQIARDKFDTNLKFSLFETLTLYNHNEMRIHLCSAIGCGKDELGGIHGSNFKENIPLLEKIIETTLPYNPYYILEVNEIDYTNKPNALWLNNKINEIIEKLSFNSNLNQ